MSIFKFETLSENQNPYNNELALIPLIQLFEKCNFIWT